MRLLGDKARRLVGDEVMRLLGDEVRGVLGDKARRLLGDEVVRLLVDTTPPDIDTPPVFPPPPKEWNSALEVAYMGDATLLDDVPPIGDWL
jgi:hypothetical protein